MLDIEVDLSGLHGALVYSSRGPHAVHGAAPAPAEALTSDTQSDWGKRNGVDQGRVLRVGRVTQHNRVTF